jgi:hypothetical protein
MWSLVYLNFGASTRESLQIMKVFVLLLIAMSAVACIDPKGEEKSQLLKLLANGKRNQVYYPYPTSYNQYIPYQQQYAGYGDGYGNYPIYVRHRNHYHKVYPQDYYMPGPRGTSYPY